MTPPPPPDLSDAALREMTVQFHFKWCGFNSPPGSVPYSDCPLYKAFLDALRAIREAQRERDAGIAEAEIDPHGDDCSDPHCQGYQKATRTIATAIRATGGTDA